MKRTLILIAALATFGCAASRNADAPYVNPFYAKYLNTGSALDAQIVRTLEALQANPESAVLHNELGALLVQKRFPNDAAREFERAINRDGSYYPAWYNLALVRDSLGDSGGARRAYRRTVRLKPGHAPALFQLGLIEEKLKHVDRAVGYYAKAYTINPALLRVDVNPRVLDSKLVPMALLRMYPDVHARQSMQFHGGAPVDSPRAQQAPSPEAPASQIIPPVAPPTDPSMQRPSTPPAQPNPPAQRQ